MRCCLLPAAAQGKNYKIAIEVGFLVRGRKQTIPCPRSIALSGVFSFFLPRPDKLVKRRSSGAMNAISALVALFPLCFVSLSEAFSTYLVEERAEVCFFRYVTSKTPLHAKVRRTRINGELSLVKTPRSPYYSSYAFFFSLTLSPSDHFRCLFSKEVPRWTSDFRWVFPRGSPAPCAGFLKHYLSLSQGKYLFSRIDNSAALVFILLRAVQCTLSSKIVEKYYENWSFCVSCVRGRRVTSFLASCNLPRTCVSLLPPHLWLTSSLL